MTGVCRCGHIDAVHFDEVLHCGACPCERFWDREEARRPRPIPNRIPKENVFEDASLRTAEDGFVFETIAQLEEYEAEQEARCYSRGDGLHEWGRCLLPAGHEEPHQDAEGYTWL